MKVPHVCTCTNVHHKEVTHFMLVRSEGSDIHITCMGCHMYVYNKGVTCVSHAHHKDVTCTSHGCHMHITRISHAHHMDVTCTSH